MRIFISGPMGGYPDNNKAAFYQAEDELRSLYPHDEIINPARLVLSEEAQWEQWMRESFKLLLACDAIVLLPGWEESRGAMAEAQMGKLLGMPLWEAV